MSEKIATTIVLSLLSIKKKGAEPALTVIYAGGVATYLTGAAGSALFTLFHYLTPHQRLAVLFTVGTAARSYVYMTPRPRLAA